MTSAHPVPERPAPEARRPPGFALLLALIALGMGIPAFFRWQVVSLGRERDRILREAPSAPEARLALLFRYVQPQILQTLQKARFSAERAWIVSHVVAPSDAAQPPEIWGIESSEIGPGATSVEGLDVRVVLPAPRLLARDVLVGDNALGVEVYAPPGPPDPRVLLRNRLEFVLAPLIEHLPGDVPGARLSVEVGGLVRPRPETVAPERR